MRRLRHFNLDSSFTTEENSAVRAAAERVGRAASSDRPVIAISLSVLAVLIQVLPSVRNAFQLDFAAAQHGEFWRFFTGHLTHWSTSHFCWDMLTFLVIGVMVERHDRRAFLATLLISALMISVGVMTFLPTLDVYRGLSGIDTALVSLAIVQCLQNENRRLKILALVALLAMSLKLTFESISGHTIFVDTHGTNFTPVPMAHFIGAVVGLMVGIVRPAFARRRVKKRFQLSRNLARRHLRRLPLHCPAT